MAIAQSGISQSIVRIFFDRSLKVLNPLAHALRCQLVEVIAPFQVAQVSAIVMRVMPRHPLLPLAAKLESEFLGNFTSDGLLRVEDIGSPANVLRAPDVPVVASDHQLDAD